jgi:plastocyanin
VKKLALVILVALLCALLTACSGSGSTGGPCAPKNLVMDAGSFCANSIALSKGGTITFVSDSNNGAVHILVIGINGEQSAEPGAPDFGGSSGHSMNPGDTWTTPPWNKDGTYHVTCTVHPQTMNLTITVTG